MKQYCTDWALEEPQNYYPADCLCGATLSAGDKDAGLELCKKAAEAGAGNGEVRKSVAQNWYNVGNIHRVRKQFDEAAAACGQAVNADSEHHEAWLCLGNSNLQPVVDKMAAVETSATKSIGPSAEQKQVLDENAKKMDAAEKAFTRYSELKPEKPVAWFSLGSVLLLREKYKEAAPAFERTLELQADYPGAWYSLGIAYYAAGRDMDYQMLRHDARMRRLDAVVKELERIPEEARAK